MVSKVSSAYNRYPLTILNRYSGTFRFSTRNKDFYCHVNFLLALCLNKLLKVYHVLTLILPQAQFHNMGKRSVKDVLSIKLRQGNGEFFIVHVDWSKEALIEAWMTDPVAACEKAGVTLPESKNLL